MDRCRQFKSESGLLVCMTLSRSGWLCLGLLVAFWLSREYRQVSTWQRASWSGFFVSAWTSAQRKQRRAVHTRAVWDVQLASYCCPLFLPAAVWAVQPAWNPQLFHSWARQGVFLFPCYFLEQKVVIVTLKCIFPSFSAQQKFLILCTIMKYHEIVITLPWKRGSLEGLWCSVFLCWWTSADKAAGSTSYSYFLKSSNPFANTSQNSWYKVSLCLYHSWS